MIYIIQAYLPFIVAAAVALFVVVVGYVFTTADDGPSTKAIEKRLHRGANMDMAGDKRNRRGSVRREYQFSSIPAVNAFLKGVLPNPDKLRIRLERTGKSFTLSELFVICFILFLVVAICLKALAGLNIAVCLTAGALVGIVLPNKVVKVMGNSRVNNFMKEFPDAIDLIVRGLRSGLPFIESVNAVAREFADPIGIEFKRITDSVRLGQSVESAMWDTAERIDSPEFKFLIVAMTIQRETGGNLAETLNNLSDLLRKRRALRLKIRALSSEARASAYIIGSLPFIMLMIISFANYEYASMLWTDERGQHMLIGGGSWMSIGFYVMWQMVNFEI